jgi:hypothetical protein
MAIPAMGQPAAHGLILNLPVSRVNGFPLVTNMQRIRSLKIVNRYALTRQCRGRAEDKRENASEYYLFPMFDFHIHLNA